MRPARRQKLPLCERGLAIRISHLCCGNMQSRRPSRYILLTLHFESCFRLDFGLKLIYAVATIVLQTGICNGIPQPSRSAEVIRDVIIIASVTFPMIALRFFSRRLVSNKLWLDDWAIVVATVRLPEIQPAVFINKLNRS